MDYKVRLDVYDGPLDLLLYLIRKNEVDIYDIPIATIADQFLEYAKAIESLDINAAGEYLVMAATLMEIKSRMLLPRPPVEDEEATDLEDPRRELVEQLLEYRQFKERAIKLEGMAKVREQMFERTFREQARIEEEAKPLEDLSLWDLFEAYSRLLRETTAAEPETIVDDETPLNVLIDQIVEQLRAAGRLSFRELLLSDRSRQSLVGVFLAILEVERLRRSRACQNAHIEQIFNELHQPQQDDDQTLPAT